MKVECQGCHKLISVQLSTNKRGKKTNPYAICECGYLAFYNGRSGEEFRRLLQKEPHKKESEGWF